MTEEFRLPDLGEGLPEAELVQWLVAEGDTVALNQTIAEVETAKAVVEIPSPAAGIVRTLHAEPGQVVDVGAVLVTFDGTDGTPDDDAPAGAGAAAPPEGASSDDDRDSGEEHGGANLVGYGAVAREDAAPRRRRRIAERSGRGADTAVLEAAPHDVIGMADTGREPSDRPRSTPPVRKLAKDLGIDIASVEPTGEAGVITRGDVEAYAGRRHRGSVRADAPRDAATRAETVPPRPGETRIPIRGVRRRTAEAMVASAFTAPHVTTFQTVDVTATTEFIAELRADRTLADHRVGVLAVVAKAVCLALGRHRSLNARWDDDAGEIVEFDGVELGIAAATPRGLIVPRIPAADALDLVALADELRSLTERARAGTSTPAELSGSTFSITNIGVFGVDAGTPILNPGEAGILAVGAVRRQPWEHRGEIALRDVMTLSLSFDHRLVDGEQGARFLGDVAAVLREPGRAMLLR